jgi:hypothetical protein
MSSYSTRTVRLGEETTLAHCGHEYLALVDLQSYAAFVDRNADHLDMMVHLAEQTRALTAISWDAPDARVRIRVVVLGEDSATNRTGWSQAGVIASGSLRTHGQLCLTSRDRLFDCARHRTHGLLRDQQLPRDERPVVLSVPPGIYGMRVCRPVSFVGRSEDSADFTIILNHHPLPARRMTPVRLPGLARWGAPDMTPEDVVVANLHADPTRRWRQS